MGKVRENPDKTFFFLISKGMAEYNDAGNDTDPENVDGDDPARDAIQSKPVRYQNIQGQGDR